MTMIQELSDNQILVQFQDTNRAVVKTRYQAFLRGNVKNPYDRSVFGIGCLGEGPYKTRNGQANTVYYSVWMAMLQRCYVEKYKTKYSAYHGMCTVCDEWLNFQNFAAWYIENHYEVSGRLHLDKDIKVPGNKVYAPDVCLLVPQRINMIFQTPSRSKDTDLPTGLHRIRKDGITWYSSRYNGVELGTFLEVAKAYDAYVTAKEKHIQNVAEEYRSIIPEKVYNALIEYRCPALKTASLEVVSCT